MDEAHFGPRLICVQTEAAFAGGRQELQVDSFGHMKLKSVQDFDTNFWTMFQPMETL